MSTYSGIITAVRRSGLEGQGREVRYLGWIEGSDNDTARTALLRSFLMTETEVGVQKIDDEEFQGKGITVQTDKGTVRRVHVNGVEVLNRPAP